MALDYGGGVGKEPRNGIGGEVRPSSGKTGLGSADPSRLARDERYFVEVNDLILLPVQIVDAISLWFRRLESGGGSDWHRW